MKLLYGKITKMIKRLSLNSKEGFTVMELIVGIAIFTILGTMVFGTVRSINKINNQESTVASETVDLQLVAQDIEQFIRRSTQSVSITTNNTIPTMTVITITDKSEPSHKMIIKLDKDKLYLNNKYQLGNIKDITLEFDDSNDSKINMKIESLSTRVNDVKQFIILKK